MTEETMPDIEPPWEWYRELAEDLPKAEPYTWRGVPGPVIGHPDYSSTPKPGRCETCGYKKTGLNHRALCGDYER